MALEASQLSVLLIEDNPGDARLVERHLERAVSDQFVDDVSMTHAGTLAAGLESLESAAFDVLLLDLGLPESTGLATLDRASDSAVSLPIIVLTGFEDRDMAVEAIARGAQDYLPKADLDSDRLIRSLRYAIERHEQEHALQRQADQMEFFNQILRHDMLNGMNVIQARGELLAERLDGEEAAFADTIVDWSDDIVSLTQKIRSILNVLTDGGETDLRPIEVAPVAESAAQRARSMGAEANVDVPDGLQVRADDLFADVLANLATNAVEHGSRSAGHDTVSLEISAVERGNRALITVADDGRGIPESDRTRIFERGEKGTGSAGSGFGLYFVNSMVEAYGGSVTVESSESGGAAFVLDVPTARTFDDL